MKTDNLGSLSSENYKSFSTPFTNKHIYNLLLIFKMILVEFICFSMSKLQLTSEILSFLSLA